MPSQSSSGQQSPKDLFMLHLLSGPQTTDWLTLFVRVYFLPFPSLTSSEFSPPVSFWVLPSNSKPVRRASQCQGLAIQLGFLAELHYKFRFFSVNLLERCWGWPNFLFFCITLPIFIRSSLLASLVNIEFLRFWVFFLPGGRGGSHPLALRDHFRWASEHQIWVGCGQATYPTFLDPPKDFHSLKRMTSPVVANVLSRAFWALLQTQSSSQGLRRLPCMQATLV